MNQTKIGKFIAESRKEKGLTQLQLAEKLNITDRAVSKWETGKSLPDASIMLELCEILDIKANELLKGEKIEENNEEKLSETIVELAKQKVAAVKTLLNLEIIIGVICVFILLASTIMAAYFNLEEWQRILLILIFGVIPLIILFPFLLKIEQKAGYYECAVCHHKHVPTFKQINMSMHMGRTRYMRCPKCNQKSWQKKVLTKDL